MGFQFERIWALLLLIPMAVYMWTLWKGLRRLQGGRKQLVCMVRTVVLLLLIFALAGTQWFTPIHNKNVVFVADRSDSVKADIKELTWIQDAVKGRSTDDETGVVSLGLRAAVEKQLDARDMNAFQFTSKVNGQFSHIASGLQLASSLLTPNKPGRIILLSDGEENVGDFLRQGMLLRDRGIPVDVAPLPAKERKDAAVEALRVPDKLHQAEAYTIEITVRSTTWGPAQLRVFEDDREMMAQGVVLSKGENRYGMQALAKEPGFHRYRAEIYLDGDEQSANNTQYAFSKVQGPPKVLIVEGQSGISKNVEAALGAALIAYETIDPALLSNDFGTYMSYDSIVLNNTAATQIPQMKMEMIEQAVRDYGVGLVMLGGEDSYGLGGYFKTPIERALPVYMDLRGKREMPSLGVVLVLDKSGSMAGEKMKLAQEAASRTVDLMRDKDTIGVLGFDSAPTWYVEPQQLNDKKGILRKINSIPADGGTEIYAAVAEAYERLAKVDVQRKHIILLTDGQSASNPSYQALTDNMQKANITMSTVAIGDDADQILLRQLAELAMGRFYAAMDQTTIPAIFSREAVLISRTYVVNQPFVPVFSGSPDWSGVLGQGLPSLNGYIAATPKEAAEVVLSSPEPDPVFARWQYGSGRSVAWTSDVTGAWSSEWVKWPSFSNMLTQVIKWTFPQFQSSPIALSSHLSGNEAVLEARNGGENGELRAVITDESLQTSEVGFTATTPDEYSATLPVDKSGVYMARLELLAEGEKEGAERRVVGSAISGFVIPYSPEYRITDGQGLGKLQQLAELTGGRMLSLEHPEQAFAFAAAPQRRLTPISEYLLMVALALLLLDIAARRISVPPALWARATAWRRSASAGPPRQTETLLARLRERERRHASHEPPPGKVKRPAAGGAHSVEAASGERPPSEKPPQSAAAPVSPAAGEASPDAMSRLLEAKRRGRK